MAFSATTAVRSMMRERPSSLWCGALDELFSEQVGRDRSGRDLVPEVVFDFRQRHGEFLAGEADGIAFRTRASRAANTMNIIRSVLGQVEIEHVTHIRDVQSA